MRERCAAVAVTLTAVVLSIKTTARSRGGKATWLEARNSSGSDKSRGRLPILEVMV